MQRALTLLLVSFLAVPVSGQELPSIAEKTEGLTRADGFFPVYWDEASGKVWLEVSRVGDEFLYSVSLPTGLGSNDIGLDRNQLGGARVVRFDRVGRKLLLIAPNLRYRALSDNAAEVAAVRDAFASGTVWAFTVAARTDDTFLVDATDFIVRDAHGVIARLQRSNQGTFRLDKNRSVPNPGVLKAFPQNTELEAQLTFTSDRPGAFVRSVAADAGAVTLRVRHSLIQLPDDEYEPRIFDPRSGYGALSFVDYAAPITEDMTVRYIRRHRLQKADPSAAMSVPVEPIIYYLDPGTPEPVRSALLDGARWWNEAYETAGFIDAFQVEMLPDDADPLDVRYNVINWVHRSTRGWSYGSSITDPRTGEIIKGHVSLGSLRVRQDYLIMEGLTSPYVNGELRGSGDPLLEVALARIRQLSAHEVGHTIGLSHNYASSVSNRASVMDYPAPMVTVNEQGDLDYSEAYDVGIGLWDKAAIQYGYTVFPDSVDERESLNAILSGAYASGLNYITDADSRPAGSAHPLAHLWDNGTNAAASLRQSLRVRARAVAAFGASALKSGEPVTRLHEILVPLYLHHRYQVEAAAKLVGGVMYDYSVLGDSRPLPARVGGVLQRDALDALLSSVRPAVLGLPTALRSGIPPRPPGYGATRELFSSYSNPIFDPYVPAEVASSLVFGMILSRERLARLMYQGDMDASLPTLSDVLASVSETILESEVPRDSYEAEIQRIVQHVWIDGLVEAADRRAAPGVRARLQQHLFEIQDWLLDNEGRDFETIAHRAYAFDLLERYLTRLWDSDGRSTPATTPPGSPIGSYDGARGSLPYDRASYDRASYDRASYDRASNGGVSTLEQVLRRQADRREWLESWSTRECGWDG